MTSASNWSFLSTFELYYDICRSTLNQREGWQRSLKTLFQSAEISNRPSPAILHLQSSSKAFMVVGKLKRWEFRLLQRKVFIQGALTWMGLTRRGIKGGLGVWVMLSDSVSCSIPACQFSQHLLHLLVSSNQNSKTLQNGRAASVGFITNIFPLPNRSAMHPKWFWDSLPTGENREIYYFFALLQYPLNIALLLPQYYQCCWALQSLIHLWT